MKIITWNCQGKFRTKSAAIAEHKPDVAVIQECECPERLEKEPSFIKPTSYQWIGEIAYKGLCVMSYTGLEFALHETFNPSIEYCLPLRVKGHKSFNIIAVWTMNHRDKNTSYIGQVYRAVGYYQNFIKNADTVIVGDFNSNKIWDKERSIGNHTDVVNKLAALGMASIYHEVYREEHGSETRPTFYMNRKSEKYKQYHIDYCFVPTSWLKVKPKCEVGHYEVWSNMSDHSPLIADFDEY